MAWNAESLRPVLVVVDSARPPGAMTSTVVAIDGFGGAGKSTLAQIVAERRGARVVHTDDFASWDDPVNWWPRLLTEVLVPLSRNQTASYRRYDWGSQTLAEWHDIEPGGLLILEGVTSSREAFRPYLAASIWVETPRDLCLKRGLERDGDGAEELWAQWMSDEDEWAAAESPREHATIIVSGAD